MKQPGHRHRIGMVRREFLQVGFSGFLGMGLSGILGARHAQGAATSGGRAKSVVIVFLTGGPSHLDMFDLKPDAPDGIRGPFKPIDTKSPGVRLSEHLPLLATHSEKLAVVRSFSHRNLNHLNSTHMLLTGHDQPAAVFDKVASRDDYPCYGSALSYLAPRNDGIPSGVMLPTFLVEGPLTWPGQHAGFLGPKFDPFQVKQDPNDKDFQVEGLSLPAGFSIERLGRRQTLSDEVGALRDQWSAHAERDPFADQQALAMKVLLSGKVAEAFKVRNEPDAVRDRYGRHMFGQSLLLARRLVQAGVPVVQVNMGRVQTWDSHGNIGDRLKNDLLPPTDKGISALLDDLAATGLLDETLVVITGEFGRSPKMGNSAGSAGVPGRDHWGHCFSSVFAGAGVRGGQVIGASDKNGAYPATHPYSPGDLAATVYDALGVKPDAELIDRLDRPSRLYDGEPISLLYTG
jgi:hypothetical protein